MISAVGICLLAGCSLPFLGGSSKPSPLPQTPDYSGLTFGAPTGIRTPSPLPTETITPTMTADLGWAPSPTPEPTHNPYRWSCIPDGSPDPCHRVLLDVAMLPGGGGWAVGERGVILRREKGEWREEESPTGSDIRRVFALAADNAWAVADEPYAVAPGEMRYRSRLLHWNGSGWKVYPNPSETGLVVDLSFLNAKYAWGISVQTRGAETHHSLMRWNGKEWSAVNRSPALNAIQILTPTEGWAVGDGGVILHWDGSAWRAVESPTDKDLDGLVFTSITSGWASSRDGVILRYALGEWWTYSAMAPSPRRMVMDPDGEDGWILGSWNRGDIVLRWDGEDWVAFSGDGPDGEVLALDFPADGEAWAAGWIPGKSRAGMIWRWDGGGWSREIEKVPVPLQAAAFLAGDDAWGVGENGLLAHWDGSEWFAAESPTGQALNAVAFLSEDDGWAAGEGGQILRWNGSEWAVERPYMARGAGNNALYIRFHALGFADPDDGWAAGALEGGDFSQPWIVRWDGRAWSEAALFAEPPPCRCSLYAMHFSSPDDGWAVGGGDQMLVMHWDGEEWTYRTWPEAYRLLAVGGAAADDVWAAGIAEDSPSSSNPGVLLHWDGSDWVSYAVPPGVVWMDAVLMTAADDGWMAGNGLLHWNGTEWGRVPSPVQGVIVALSRTPDGAVWAATDTGSVLRLEVE
ncbi:MAG: hypothetical protein JW929_16005 [Anaerolineales bacterium]|nr:hypothetical protein [Anaerolineales bacterium]